MDKTAIQKLGEQLIKNGDISYSYYSEEYILSRDQTYFPSLEGTVLAWLKKKFE